MQVGWIEEDAERMGGRLDASEVWGSLLKQGWPFVQAEDGDGWSCWS